MSQLLQVFLHLFKYVPGLASQFAWEQATPVVSVQVVSVEVQHMFEAKHTGLLVGQDVDVHPLALVTKGRPVGLGLSSLQTEYI